MNKYTSMLVLVVLLSIIIIAGCEKESIGQTAETDIPNAANQPDDQVKLNVLTNRVDLIENGVFQKYADKFAELNPGVTVQFEGITNYVSDIMIRFSTGSFGDVLLLPNNIKNEDLPNYFEPLDESLFQHIRFADFKKYGNKRYGIATGASTTGIVYNKAAFQAAGITEVPTTLDEFYKACEKLKEAGIVPVYLNYGAQWPLMSWSEDLVSYMTGDANYLNNMAFTDEPWAIDNPWGQAISIVKTLINRGYVEKQLLTNQWELSKTELAHGRAGMYLMGNWVINQVIAAGAKSEDIGFFPFPYDNSGTRFAPLSPDWFLGVSKFSKNKQLAEAWVKFFVNDSGYVDDSGFLPVDDNKEPSLPQFQQFLSFNISFLERQIASDQFLELANTARIEFWSGNHIQEWIAAPDLNTIFKQYNERWKEAQNISKS
ncbi:ABC-type glycerol-3-phosphate transport system substrate-binding protein [Paenibacillus castaneae]|uniref:ABC transporter substrate-binding protein n=1 Tax=Paenibacillus castaneae TaxID=474957 RepID=UPI000C9C34DD|nr:ABC transporter substrate-binding protein [Paenibacillus castaneae]NIK80233.1 ABC-type glycerol-3-phosphate transport system substrate-binding protein [Paenibacillus castaneae]